MPQPESGSIFRPPEIFQTKRLVLRKPRAEDVPVLFDAYMTDRKVVRYLTWRPHETVGETYAAIDRWDEEWRKGESFPFTLSAERAMASPFGMIHLRRKDHAVWFGYVLRESHWGQGYATEALSALVDWALSQPGIYRASASCDVDNPASGRVMEKAGMRFEGTLKRFVIHPNMSAEPRDAMMYARVV